MNSLDVAVIGAGPAGAWAAYRLARAGARVRMFDHSHPREKPCGGGVTGRALRIVADAIDVAALSAQPIRTARFLDDCGRAAAVPLDDCGVAAGAALVVASRSEFDGRLTRAACDAGAELVTERVLDVGADAHGAVVRTRTAAHRAEWVIGADGANSLVRRRVAAPFARGQLSVAAGWYADGATSDEIVLEFVSDPPGYLWSFPRPSHLAIGICAQADQSCPGPLRARAEHWIRRRSLVDAAALRPYAWPIPSLSPQDFKTLVLAGRRWMLVGDAAGLVDPITREGIFQALRSSDLAVDALSDANPARAYADAVAAEIGDDLARAAQLKRGFFHPRFTRLLVDALTSSAAVRAVMADLVAGRQSYGRLKWRLAGTLEVGLAWRWLRQIRGAA